MTLPEIKSYFEEHRVASMQDLVSHFNLEDDVMRDMLAHWIRKGKLRKIETTAGHCSKCPSCASCYSLAMEVYEWID